MSTLEKEFFRTQREAGIFHAPWADNVSVQRAAGVAMGVILVGVSTAIMMAVLSGLLRLLVSP